MVPLIKLLWLRLVLLSTQQPAHNVNKLRKLNITLSPQWLYGLLILLPLSLNAHGEELSYLDLSQQVMHLQSADESTSIEQAIASSDWIELERNADFGVSEGPNWFKINIPEDVTTRENILFEGGHWLLEDVQFYYVVSGEIVKNYTSGSLNKLSERPLKSRKIIFPLPQLEQGTAKNASVYLRVESKGRTFVPIRIWEQRSFVKYEKAETLYAGFFIGAIFILSVYHLLLFIKTPYSYIIFYAIGAFASAASNVGRWGIGYEYIWPENPISGSVVMYSFSHLAAALLTLFFIQFTSLNTISRKVFNFFVLLTAIHLSLFVLTPIVPLSFIISLADLTVILSTLSLILASIWLLHLKVKAAVFYLLALSPPALVVTIARFMMYSGDSRIYAEYLGSSAVIFIVCALALAIAHRIRDKEEEAAEEISVLNDELEQKVIERTKSLDQSLEDLKHTQQQLIEAEKVASMTSLVSGVAHEINTPLGICITAASNLKDQNATMLQSFNDNKLSRSALSAYLDKTDAALDMIEHGLERSANLVKRFKSLAVDSAHQTHKPIEVFTTIDDTVRAVTLTLAQPPTININCDNSLVVETAPSLLDQLFSQLLHNSIAHAFEDMSSARIEITAMMEGSDLCLTYSDNGKGLSENESENLFDPFKTTARKDGRAGLGTTTIYNIIVYGLKGKIDYHSAPGKGLTYHMQFPVKLLDSLSDAS